MSFHIMMFKHNNDTVLCKLGVSCSPKTKLNNAKTSNHVHQPCATQANLHNAFTTTFILESEFNVNTTLQPP